MAPRSPIHQEAPTNGRRDNDQDFACWGCGCVGLRLSWLPIQSYANDMHPLCEGCASMATLPNVYVTCLLRYRKHLRQFLSDHGVRSNPGWSDDDVLDAVRAAMLNNKDAAA